MVTGLVLMVLTARRPIADIRIITHETRDPSPRKMQAAVVFGLVRVSIIYT